MATVIVLNDFGAQNLSLFSFFSPIYLPESDRSSISKKFNIGTFLAIQWLRFRASNAGALSLVRELRSYIPAMWCSQKKRKKGECFGAMISRIGTVATWELEVSWLKFTLPRFVLRWVIPWLPCDCTFIQAYMCSEPPCRKMVSHSQEKNVLHWVRGS